MSRSAVSRSPTVSAAPSSSPAPASSDSDVSGEHTFGGTANPFGGFTARAVFAAHDTDSSFETEDHQQDVKK